MYIDPARRPASFGRPTLDRAPPRPRPADRHLLYYLSLVGFFAIFSTTLSKNPVLPLFASSLGASGAVIGAIAAVSPLAGIVFSYPVGVLSDRAGRKRILVLAGIIFMVSPLLYLLVDQPLWLIPVRFFHGTATAILGPVVSALIADRFSAARGRTLGAYSSATLVGRAAAPIVGGAVLSFFAASPGLLPYHAVYAVAFAAAVPVVVLVLLLDEGDPGNPSAGPIALKESFVAFVADPLLRATSLVEAGTYFCFGTFETFLPVLMAARGSGAYETGIVFALQVVVIAATKPLFGHVSDRAGRSTVVLSGVVLIAVSMAAIPFSYTYLAVAAASVGVGLGMSLATVATGALVADVSRSHQLGASMGALSAVMDIGHSSGPLLAGLVIVQYGFAGGFLGAAALAFATAIWFTAAILREKVRPETES